MVFALRISGSASEFNYAVQHVEWAKIALQRRSFRFDAAGDSATADKPEEPKEEESVSLRVSWLCQFWALTSVGLRMSERMGMRHLHVCQCECSRCMRHVRLSEAQTTTQESHWYKGSQLCLSPGSQHLVGTAATANASQVFHDMAALLDCMR